MTRPIKMLLTGGDGQLGRKIAEVIPHNVELHGFNKHSLDITNKDLLFTTIEQIRPDVIVNAAAYTAVDKAEEEFELADLINHTGPALLAEAANEYDATLIHVSTDYVFSGDSESLYKETDLPSPISQYGLSKLQGEISIQEITAKYIILRTAWVFSEYGSNFVKTMLKLGQSHTSLNIVADQFGGPTYAGHLAEAIHLVANKVVEKGFNDWGIYHFSGEPYVSWYDFAGTIFDEANKQGVLDQIPKLGAIKSDQYPTAAKRPLNARLNNRKIRNTFNVYPSDWRLALKNLKHYSSNL
ncbi:dTDP-4-dehydrorhamnose reductase [Glaciecola sp. 1036]|uniref:dTDP-4-dehydrorhamnose reductase n=1 Tax=Alteromonadaceae TaxID=72275 RepID=UPI003D07E671